MFNYLLLMIFIVNVLMIHFDDEIVFPNVPCPGLPCIGEDSK